MTLFACPQIAVKRTEELAAMFDESVAAVQRLQDWVVACAKQVEAVFGTEASRQDLIPLLVLSEDFDAPVLRHALVQLIRREKDAGQFLIGCSSEITRCTSLLGERGIRKVFVYACRYLLSLRAVYVCVLLSLLVGFSTPCH